MSKRNKKKQKNQHVKQEPKQNNCCIDYALISEVVANYGADTFWLASLFDTLTYWSLSPIEILGISTGVSIPALVIGSIVALLSSMGYASSRKDVNLKMSGSDEDEENYGSITNNHADIESGDLADDETQELNEDSGSLSLWQYLKLAGHLISTAGDVAAMPMAIFTLVDMKVPLPKVANLLVRCGATLWGATAAIAPTQACAKAMKSMNKRQI